MLIYTVSRRDQGIIEIIDYLWMCSLTQTDQTGEHPLISLGAASRILGVKEVTVRHWANRGLVQVFRTQGGHRRFLRDQIVTLSPHSLTLSGDEAQLREERALRYVRRRLRRGGQAKQPWYRQIEGEVRIRFRLFGRRLLSLLAHSGPEVRPRRQVVEEARLLGYEHGVAMATQNHPLTDTLSAYIFFRDSALDTFPIESRRQALLLADQVMLGIAEAYQETVQQALS